MPQQVWLITGTSSGFGAEFVKDLLSCGDKVVATARNLSIIPHLKNRGAVITLLDIPAPQVELEAKTHEAIAIYGHVNVLVNNAGYAHFGIGLRNSTSTSSVYQCNTVSFASLPQQKERNACVFGSVTAWHGVPAVGVYCSSKFALRDNLKLSTPSIPSIFNQANGKQPGNPVRGVDCIISVVKGERDAAYKPWTNTLALGSDAVRATRRKCEDTLTQLAEWEELSRSSDFANDFIKTYSLMIH
ncbi:hypothetical protein BDW59DRAFT_176848 [Aspergillus cavernicola]|uniref:NAD(P)-binding protein n=1 Tax=Aspergillus cavernicola TaxID=176166 RepID=A0ABR4HE71_9EURO